MVTCTDFVKEGNKVVEVRAEGRKLSSDEKPPKVSAKKWLTCSAAPFTTLAAVHAQLVLCKVCRSGPHMVYLASS